MSDSALRKIRILDQYLIANFHMSFGNRIMKQINEYIPVMIACGGTEEEAIDDMLVRKVLRKLESQNPSFIRNSVDGLKDQIAMQFGAQAMPQCLEYLDMLKNTL